MLSVSTLVRHGGSLSYHQPFFSMKVVRAFAAQKNEKRRRISRKKAKDSTYSSGGLSPGDKISSSSDGSPITGIELPYGNVAADAQTEGPSRTAVLQACTVTSVLLLAAGCALRQASHVASLNGWPVLDATEVSFDFEIWHLELIAGLVVLISSSRYVLLGAWSDFAESSEAANRQILASLEPLDYVAVSFLPGISEELLFRGALMPIFGVNWASALITGALFGILHLGSGRRYAFTVWATFVGFAYGLATIASSSIIVPMASHSINNIIGAVLWRVNDRSEGKYR